MVLSQEQHELIRGRYEGDMTNHTEGVKALFENESANEIIENFALNVPGIMSVLSDMLINIVEGAREVPQKKKDEVYEKISKEAQDMSIRLAKDTNLHPADVATILIKYSVDILMQTTVIESLKKENLL